MHSSLNRSNSDRYCSTNVYLLTTPYRAVVCIILFYGTINIDFCCSKKRRHTFVCHVMKVSPVMCALYDIWKEHFSRSQRMCIIPVIQTKRCVRSLFTHWSLAYIVYGYVCCTTHITCVFLYLPDMLCIENVIMSRDDRARHAVLTE